MCSLEVLGCLTRSSLTMVILFFVLLTISVYSECDVYEENSIDQTSVEQLIKSQKQSGYSLQILDGYYDEEMQTSLFNAVWTKDCEGQTVNNEIILILDESDIQTEISKLSSSNYCPIFINAFNTDSNTVKFILKYEMQSCNEYQIFYDLAEKDFESRHNTLTQTDYKIQWISGYEQKWKTYFAAIYILDGTEYELSYALTSTSFHSETSLNKAKGTNIKMMNQYSVQNSAKLRFVALYTTESVHTYRTAYYSQKFIQTQQLWIDNAINSKRNEFEVISGDLTKKMAVSVGVSYEGNIVYAKGYGIGVYADQSADGMDVAVTATSKFRLASNGKHFTNSGILLLIQRGQISLTDTVFGDNGLCASKFDINGKAEEEILAKIQIEYLLSMTAQLSGYQYSSSDSMTESIQDVIDKGKFMKSPFIESDIGKVHKYSNVPYNVLGVVIECVTNVEYEQWIKENLLKPAGINVDNVHVVESLYKIDRFEDEVMYYSGDANGNGAYCSAQSTCPWFPRTDFLSINAPAGGWVMSVVDLLKFDATIDGFDKVSDILDKEYTDLLSTQSDVPTGWLPTYTRGGGWNYGDGFRYHDGMMAGTYTYDVRYDDGRAGAILFNYNDGDHTKIEELVAGRGAMNSILSEVDFKTWPCSLYYDSQCIEGPECAVKINGVSIFFDGTYQSIGILNGRRNYELRWWIFQFFIFWTGDQWVVSGTWNSKNAAEYYVNCYEYDILNCGWVGYAVDVGSTTLASDECGDFITDDAAFDMGMEEEDENESSNEDDGLAASTIILMIVSGFCILGIGNVLFCVYMKKKLMIKHTQKMMEPVVEEQEIQDMEDVTITKQ